MSDVAAIIAAMVRAGVDADLIGQAAATFATAKPSDTAAEKRRAYDRDRKRNGKSGGIPVEVSGGKSGGIPPETTALTRVRDITSTSVDRPNHTALCGEPEFSADVSWPESDRPSRASLDRLAEALADAAGPALAPIPTTPGLLILSPILKLAATGKGPPCDLHADVLPTIRARSARAPPGSIKSWVYFVQPITEARDKRLSGAPATEPLRPANDRQSSRNRRDEQFMDHLQGIQAAMDAAG